MRLATEYVVGLAGAVDATVVQDAPPSDDDSTTYDWIVEPESVGAVQVSDAEVPAMLAATAVGAGNREDATAEAETTGLARRKPVTQYSSDGPATKLLLDNK